MRHRLPSIRVLHVATLALACSCARAASAPGRLAPERGGTVESRWEDGHIFVRLWLGDRPLWLLLDSGASNTLVRANVLADIRAKPLGDAFMDGTTRRLPVHAFSGAVLRADSITIAVPTLYELPSGVPALDGVSGVDGIVGFELFAQSRVALDPPRRTVQVFAAADSSVADHEDVPFDVARRLPIVEAELWFADGGTVQAPFILDLGSNGDVRLSASFAARHDVASRLSDRQQGIQSGLWTNDEGVEGRAAALKIGRDIVRAPTVFISADSIGAFARADVAGTIGLGVLQHFRVRFDYDAGRVSLHQIMTFARRDTTHECVAVAPRRPVMLRGGPTGLSASGLASAHTSGSDPDCPAP